MSLYLSTKDSMKGNTKTLERFLGKKVIVKLKTPSGREATLPLDKLVYKEWTNELKEGFYLSSFGCRLKPSQLIKTSIGITSNGKVYPTLHFDFGRNVMESLDNDSIKNQLYSDN